MSAKEIRMESFDPDEEEVLGFISRVRKGTTHHTDKRRFLVGAAIGVFGMLLVILVIVLVIALPWKTDDSPLGTLSRTMKGAADTSVDPCDDFYQYSCGSWLKHAKAQLGSQGSASLSFAVIAQAIDVQLTEILDSNPPILGSFYQDCLSSQPNIDPLLPFMQRIGDTNSSSILETVASLHQYGVSALFSAGVEEDPGNTYQNIFTVGEGGLSLPLDFYISDDPYLVQFRQSFQQYIFQILKAVYGDKVPTSLAASVLNFEIGIALITLPPANISSPLQMYNKVPFEQFQALSPQLNWTSYFAFLDVDPININVESPTFVRGMEQLLNQTDIKVVQAYLMYHLVSDMAEYVGGNTLELKLEWKELVEPKQLKASSSKQHCVDTVNSLMGDLLGKYFAESVPDELRGVALNLISEVRGALKDLLSANAWMDPTTKSLSLNKLSHIGSKVLYPSEWPDYSQVPLVKGKFFESSLVLRRYLIENSYKSLHEPVDKSSWLMSPQTVNAYYNPTNNEIVIPAGILKTPFYSSGAPAWNVYGSIGLVLGHELSHAFDNSGRFFDANGTLRNWWTNETSNIFNSKAQCVVEQYNGYTILPGLNVNGVKTLGENIADLGGVRIAYAAYKSHVAKNGQGYSDKELRKYFPDWTDDQLFFLSFGQLWCELVGEDSAELLYRADVHSPGRYRVIGALSAFETFADVFQCPVGSKMHPQHECRVW